MTLKETQSYKIEISEVGVVFVEKTTKITKDSIEIATGSNRTGYHPGADVTGLPQHIQDICAAAWTQEVVDAFNAKVHGAKEST